MLELLTSLLLALFQIAMQKCLVSALKKNLRTLPLTTGEPAKKSEKEKAENYGLVVPLFLAVAALRDASPMQPSSMFSMVSSK